ncbi:ATP-dependent RNA helicase [Clonorchis sinensis]|uniref:ATP-dependent RNA helicase n=1 Tax=Clonorchis sinensis TaxID=79923 RepID=H2KQC9_CLOSI|nr:ATP-dependent RNA helicase [Clonorchis sinensis]
MEDVYIYSRGFRNDATACLLPFQLNMSYTCDQDSGEVDRKFSSLNISKDHADQSAAFQIYVPSHLRNRGAMSKMVHTAHLPVIITRDCDTLGALEVTFIAAGVTAVPSATADRLLIGDKMKTGGLISTEDSTTPERLEQELVKKISTGINCDQYDNIPVSATGPDFNDEASAVSSFSDLAPYRIIRSNVELAQYNRPTPVQKHAINIIASGRDLMTCAQSGSGKTAAFLIPILNRMIEEGPGDSLSAALETNSWKQLPVGLILAPTRELASQIFDDAIKSAYRPCIRPCVLYGGANMRTQLIEVSKGCNLLVAASGRLTDVIERERVGLDHCRVLVFDEADRMLDMGFELQIRRIVEQDNLPPSGTRQTLMFSATFPHEMQVFAKDFPSRHLFLTVN